MVSGYVKKTCGVMSLSAYETIPLFLKGRVPYPYSYVTIIFQLKKAFAFIVYKYINMLFFFTTLSHLTNMMLAV